MAHTATKACRLWRGSTNQSGPTAVGLRSALLIVPGCERDQKPCRPVVGPHGVQVVVDKEANDHQQVMHPGAPPPAMCVRSSSPAYAHLHNGPIGNINSDRMICLTQPEG